MARKSPSPQGAVVAPAPETSAPVGGGGGPDAARLRRKSTSNASMKKHKAENWKIMISYQDQ